MEGALWGRRVEFLVDTGASVNVLSMQWWKNQGYPGVVVPTEQKVYTADGRPMGTNGVVEGRLRWGDEERITTFVISDIATEAIVGSDFLKKHRIMVDIAGTRLLWDRLAQIIPCNQSVQGGEQPVSSGSRGTGSDNRGDN